MKLVYDKSKKIEYIKYLNGNCNIHYYGFVKQRFN